MKKIISILLLGSLLASGCGLKAREEAVEKKEAELLLKEQQLLLKEKQISLAEEALQKRTADTVNTDTSLAYNTALVGEWSVKMICTETTCAGSAVGDTKAEVWIFSYQDHHLVAKAMAGNKLVRIYTGGFTGNTIELLEDIQHSPSAPATKLLVRLTATSEHTMEGQREIVRENDCKIIYTLQLNKQ